MSLFNDIMFMNEGQQAEEYLKKSIEEGKKQAKEDEERNDRRYKINHVSTNPQTGRYERVKGRAKETSNVSYATPAGNQARRYDSSGDFMSDNPESHYTPYLSYTTPDKEKHKADKERDANASSVFGRLAMDADRKSKDAYKKYKSAYEDQDEKYNNAKKVKEDFENSKRGLGRFSKTSKNLGAAAKKAEEDYTDARSKYRSASKEYHKIAAREDEIRRDELMIRDAINRNMRRHPERWDGDKPRRESCGIFESVFFFDEI